MSKFRGSLSTLLETVVLVIDFNIFFFFFLSPITFRTNRTIAEQQFANIIIKSIVRLCSHVSVTSRPNSNARARTRDEKGLVRSFYHLLTSLVRLGNDAARREKRKETEETFDSRATSEYRANGFTMESMEEPAITRRNELWYIAASDPPIFRHNRAPRNFPAISLRIYAS